MGIRPFKSFLSRPGDMIYRTSSASRQPAVVHGVVELQKQQDAEKKRQQDQLNKLSKHDWQMGFALHEHSDRMANPGFNSGQQSAIDRMEHRERMDRVTGSSPQQVASDHAVGSGMGGGGGGGGGGFVGGDGPPGGIGVA